MNSGEIGGVDRLRLLEGVRVVELSHGVSGAYCGKILAQLGAAVCRVGPDTSMMASTETRAAMQHVLHGCKTRLEADSAELRDALSGADVIIAETGSDDTSLKSLVDGVVDGRIVTPSSATVLMLSAAAGKDGPIPACTLTSAAWGAMSWAIGEPAREPLTVPYEIGDHEAGISSAAAAVASLLGGQWAARKLVDVSARDVLTQFVGMLAQNYLPYGRPWQRDGRRPFKSGGIYPLGLFSCKDGHVAIYCRSDREWHGIIKAMGDPAWSNEPRLRDARLVAREHSDEADSHFLPWLAQHTKTELLELGLKFGFPAAPVRVIDEVLHDVQFRYRGSLHPEAVGRDGPVMVPTVPWRIRESAEAGAGRAWPARKDASGGPSGILEGIRVLDLSWVWSGPMVTSLLADLGADVIKIEHPSRLDSVRQRGSSQRDGKELEGPSTELNPWFNQLNHGKRSVVLDIKSAEGREQVLALARTCDVVVENMRPGALDKLGLGYAQMARENPAMVMLSMSLAGQSGPLSHMKGYAGIMTSMAGMESLVGYPEKEGPATVVGMTKTALGDPNAAMHGTSVLLAALYRRRITGRGLWIDLSQTDAILYILAGPLVESQLTGNAPVWGNHHPLHAPHGHYRCRGHEQWLALAATNDEQWHALTRVLGHPGLASLDGLDVQGRIARRDEIDSHLSACLGQRNREEVLARLVAAGVPAAPVATWQELEAASWRRERGISCFVDHPWLGRQEILLPPWKFSGMCAGVHRAAPLLGADTEAVLAELPRHCVPD